MAPHWSFLPSPRHVLCIWLPPLPQRGSPPYVLRGWITWEAKSGWSSLASEQEKTGGDASSVGSRKIPETTALDSKGLKWAFPLLSGTELCVTVRMKPGCDVVQRLLSIDSEKSICGPAALSSELLGQFKYTEWLERMSQPLFSELEMYVCLVWFCLTMFSWILWLWIKLLI